MKRMPKVSENVIKKNITHKDYKDTVQNKKNNKKKKQMYHTMKTVRSECHQICSCELNKISLSCFDDKRYILADGQSSYTNGHYKILN